jgi:urate oxidase
MVVDSFKIVHSEYGKVSARVLLVIQPDTFQGGVKILHVCQSGTVHSIRELEVETLLTLASSKDYREGDNSDIIATDTQKNTVYVLAKQHGISTPEEFGLLLVTHFISKYPWVVKARYNRLKVVVWI